MSGALAGNILGMVLGQGMQGMNDDRQVNLQGRLGAQSVEQWRRMMDLQAQKELKMWEATNYNAQKEQMKKAGLNPALLYGMGGGGGQSMGGGAPMPNSGTASGGGGQEIPQMLGLAQQGVAQVALLKAQKENIEADTQNKKADTTVKTAQEQGMGQENAIRALLIGTDPEGKDISTGEISAGAKGMAFQKEAQEYRERAADIKVSLDRNEREKLMNSKVMEEIGQRISLMVQQGLKEGEIYRNLQKEGKLLDAEIEWNALDIDSGNVGKFISNVIRLALKPR